VTYSVLPHWGRSVASDQRLMSEICKKRGKEKKRGKRDPLSSYSTNEKNVKPRGKFLLVAIGERGEEENPLSQPVSLRKDTGGEKKKKKKKKGKRQKSWARDWKRKRGKK